MYNAQADTIDVDGIVTNSNNRIVLRRLKRNDANDELGLGLYESLFIQHQHDDDGERCRDYVPEGTNDMGWLGYFVGKNNHLKRLYIHSFTPTSGASVRDVIGPFFRGVNCNKSIQEIFFSGVDLLGGEVFTMLGSFFKNNHNLTKIIITDCVQDWGRLFALALGSSTNKSLKKVDLQDNDISEEGVVNIITALSTHTNLQCLILDGNRLRKNGCVALATLLRCSAKELQYLYLSETGINDEGIEALVPALTKCNRLEGLYLSNNHSTTTRGWQGFATVLEAPNSNLRELFIFHKTILTMKQQLHLREH